VREHCAVAYGNDVSVFVEDNSGDLGGPTPSPKPFWLSPDVDIPAHTGRAVQGANDVQIRVHSQEEPILDEKIAAEVYVGNPSLAMSPTVGMKRIDPGNLRFRPPNLTGTEPVASNAGGTLTFSWTPSSSAGAIDGPGHHCLVVRAFPVSLTPPGSPFDVPNEQHEAQHNIDILSTTTTQAMMISGGAGTPEDPRRRDKDTGLWWERFSTLAARRRGKHYIVWAFDPDPSAEIVDGVRRSLKGTGFRGFSKEPPGSVTLEPVKARGGEIATSVLLKDREFASTSGLGRGLFARKRLLAAAVLDLGPRTLSGLILRFDHSNLHKRTGAVLHGIQWNDKGEPEGGITVIALAPTDP
jgi:hypothetical protein